MLRLMLNNSDYYYYYVVLGNGVLQDDVFGNSLENVHAEEGKGTKDGSEKDEEEEDSGDKEIEKDVVNVDELELDDVPLAQRLDDSMAKRLRSNKGRVVASGNETPKKTTATMTETPKSQTKSASVGPRKRWSKVIVKSVVGSSRKEDEGYLFE